jgi:hypothetical protein
LLNKQHHTNNFTSEDIARYLKREMSAEEMHAMEKAALDDPFLADAMEGFTETSLTEDKFSSDLAELRTRLQERTNMPSDGKGVVSFTGNTWWRVAAAVMLLAGSGALVYTVLNMSAAENSAQLAKTQTPDSNFDTTTFAAPADTQTSANLSTPYTQQQEAVSSAESNSTVLRQDKSRKETTPPAMQPAKEEGVAAEAGIAANEPGLAKSGISNQRNIGVAAPAAANQEQQAVKDQASNNAKMVAPFAGNSFNGRVVDAENNPIAGASVIVKNKELGVSTDKDGSFNVIVPDSNIRVQVGSVGFESRELTLKTNLTDNRIVLKRSQEPAAYEMISPAAGYRNRSKRTTTASADVTPVNGWPQYQAYISKNKRIAVRDSSVHGAVIVSFTLNKKGKPTDLEIEQSLTRSHDVEAMRLVKEGPAWKPLKAKTRGRVAITF